MTALTNAENTALALPNQTVRGYLSYSEDTIVATGTVSTSPPSSPIILLSISGESAGWTNMKQFQTVKITDSTGSVLRGYYYIREVTATGSLAIGETSIGDPGLVAIGNRPSPIVNSDRVTILERYDLHVIKPYMNASLDIFMGRTAVGTNNLTPPLAAANVSINGQPGKQFSALITAGTKLAMTLVITPVKHPTSSGSTVTYAWTGTGTWSSVSGTSTATLTGIAPVGKYKVYCTVDDSIGGPTEITCEVHIYDLLNPPLSVNILSDVRDSNARKATVRLVENRQAVLPAYGMVWLWSQGDWGGFDVPTATKSFTGFITNKTYSHVPGFYEANVEIAGPMAILDKRRGYARTWFYDPTADTWEKLPASLCNYHFLAWFILQWGVTNFLRCFNYTPYDTTGTSKKRKNSSVAAGTSIGSQLKYLMGAIDMNIGSRSEGTIKIAPIPSLLFNRIELVTRGTLPNSTYNNIDLQLRSAPEVGSVTQIGYFSDLTVDARIDSIGPELKTAGMGSNDESRQDRLWDGQQNANEQTGLLLTMLNNEYDTVSAEILNNWDVIEPVDQELVVVTVPANRSPTGVAITLNTVPTSITKKWTTGGGRASLQFKGVPLTTSVTNAETKPVNLPQDNLYDPNTVTPPDSTSDLGWGGEDTNPDISSPVPPAIIATYDGFVTLGVDAATWKDISPTADQRGLGNWIKLIINPHNYSSAVLYGDAGCLVCDNITADVPTWNFYDLIREGIPSNPTPDEAVTGDTSGWSFTHNFATGKHGWSVSGCGVFGNNGTYIAGTGFESISGSGFDQSLGIRLDFSNTVSGIYEIQVTKYQAVSPLSGGGRTDTMLYTDTGHSFNFMEFMDDTLGTSTTTRSIFNPVNRTGLGLIISDQNGPHGPHYFYSITVRGTGTLPILPGSTPKGPSNDIIGSINAEGIYYWIAQNGSSTFVGRTADNFQSIDFTEAIASYLSTMQYGLTPNSYNAQSLLLTAGTPGSDGKVYKSSDGAKTFSDEGTALTDAGGAINAGYIYSAANSGVPPLFFAVTGQSGGSTLGHASNASSHAIFAANKTIPQFGVGSLTIGSLSMTIVTTDGSLAKTDDGGLSWATPLGTIPIGNDVKGWTGLPNKVDGMMTFGDETFAISNDRGDTWFDLYASNYDTFRAATYGSGGKVIIWAQVRMDILYPGGPVTT